MSTSVVAMIVQWGGGGEKRWGSMRHVRSKVRRPPPFFAGFPFFLSSVFPSFLLLFLFSCSFCFAILGFFREGTCEGTLAIGERGRSRHNKAQCMG